MRHRPARIAITVLVAFVAAAGATVAFAQIPDSEGIINACYHTGNGGLRVVDDPTHKARRDRQAPTEHRDRQATTEHRDRQGRTARTALPDRPVPTVQRVRRGLPGRKDRPAQTEPTARPARQDHPAQTEPTGRSARRGLQGPPAFRGPQDRPGRRVRHPDSRARPWLPCA